MLTTFVYLGGFWSAEKLSWLQNMQTFEDALNHVNISAFI